MLKNFFCLAVVFSTGCMSQVPVKIYVPEGTTASTVQKSPATVVGSVEVVGPSKIVEKSPVQKSPTTVVGTVEVVGPSKVVEKSPRLTTQQPHGDLTVITDPIVSSMILVPNSDGVHVASFGLKANPNEDVRVTDLSITILQGQEAVKSMALFDGERKLTPDVMLINGSGKAEFKNFSSIVAKNTTKNFLVKLSTTKGNTFPVQGRLIIAKTYIRYNGLDTGVNVQSYVPTTIGKVHTLQATKAVILPAGNSPMGKKVPEKNQEIATFDVVSVGYGSVGLKSLRLKVIGSYADVGTISNYELYDGAQRISQGTNSNGGVTGAATNEILFPLDHGALGYAITEALTKNLSIRANTERVKNNASSVNIAVVMDGDSVEYSYPVDASNFMTVRRVENAPLTFASLTY